MNKMKPVFSDPNGVAWDIFDAPEPWGPWTTKVFLGLFKVES
jgi:hypothetical protein